MRNTCISNIEKGSSEVWKNKAQKQYIPTTEEIFIDEANKL